MFYIPLESKSFHVLQKYPFYPTLDMQVCPALEDDGWMDRQIGNGWKERREGGGKGRKEKKEYIILL